MEKQNPKIIHLQTVQRNRQQAALDKYIRIAARLGCTLSQIQNFIVAEIVLQEKQLIASGVARVADTNDGPVEIGYGGARGGGKSHWLISQMGADDCQRFPGLKCLLLRKIGKSNRESFNDLRIKLFSKIPHTYAANDGVLTFTNSGSRIIAGHFQNEGDIDKYLGLEYDVIGVEEATTLTKSKYVQIQTCCRTSKSGWRPRIYSTTNPGGVGHSWYVERFIKPFRSRKQTDTCFVPSTIDDNKFVNNEYKKVLDGLTGWLKKAWRHGDWNIAVGQYFTNYRADIHVIRPPQIQYGWTLWAGMDYGFAHYTSFYLIGKDGDGNHIILDEYNRSKTLPDTHAKEIKRMLGRNHMRYHSELLPLDLSVLRTIQGGSDFFRKQYTGKSIAETYKLHGVTISEADDDRVAGAANILTLLGDVDQKVRPRLFISEKCQRLISCLPELTHDPDRPEDVLKVDVDEDGNGGDDPYDAVRYGLQWSSNMLQKKKIGGI